MIHPCPIPLPRFSREQGAALEHIGIALAQGHISWKEALVLRELVQESFVGSALNTMRNHTRQREAA